MKIAEALIQRADLQKRIEQIKTILGRNALVEEGDRPAFEPATLLRQLDGVVEEFTEAVQKINKANSSFEFEQGKTIADVLAERDGLLKKRAVLQSFRESALQTVDRYSRTEIKLRSTYSPVTLQKEIDDLAMRYREIDNKIQELNWKYEI